MRYASGELVRVLWGRGRPEQRVLLVPDSGAEDVVVPDSQVGVELHAEGWVWWLIGAMLVVSGVV